MQCPDLAAAGGLLVPRGAGRFCHLRAGRSLCRSISVWALPSFTSPSLRPTPVLPSRCAPEEQPAPHHCIPVFRSFQIPTLSSSAPGAPPSLVLSADLTKPYLWSITQPINENTEQRQNGRKERQRDAADRAAVVKPCIRGGTENNAEDPAPQPTLRERPACHGQDWPSWDAAP